MRRRFSGMRRRVGRLAGAVSGAALFLAAPTLAWATSTAGVGPWDTTLNLIQTDLSGPVAHALVTSAFVGSEVPLRHRRRSQSRVSRPAAAGLDGVAALRAVQVMGQLFLYSPMWF